MLAPMPKASKRIGRDGEAWVATEDAKAELKVGEEVTHKKALLAADERQVGGDMHRRRTKRQKVPQDLARLGVPDTTRRDCASFAGLAAGVYS